MTTLYLIKYPLFLKILFNETNIILYSYLRTSVFSHHIMFTYICRQRIFLIEYDLMNSLDSYYRTFSKGTQDKFLIPDHVLLMLKVTVGFPCLPKNDLRSVSLVCEPNMLCPSYSDISCNLSYFQKGT